MSDQTSLLSSKPARIGLIVSAIWLVGTLTLYLAASHAFAFTFVNIVAFLMPLLLIWFAVFIAMAAQDLATQARDLRDGLDQLKGASVAPPARGYPDFEIKSQLEQIAELTQRNDTRMAAIAAKALDDTGHPMPPRETAALPDTAPRSLSDMDQGDLPFPASNQDGRIPISIPEFIKALNFPDDADDKEGFRVLRRALEDHRTAPLINAAKDVLTMLSEDGIYMDDYRPDRAKIDLWRQFAKGKRGKSVAALGGIEDRAVISIASAKLKGDPEFQTTAHVFMQQFTNVLETFETTADDSELHAMADTRSARCFMVLGRISGTFVK